MLSCSVLSYAQEQYEVQKIDGVEYYVYPVKQSEGLYRISVNFGVSMDEIAKINPEVNNGLKVGQILFIPKRKEIEPTQNNVATAQIQQPSNKQTPPAADIIAATLGGRSNNTIAKEEQAKENTPETFQKIDLKQKEPHFYYHKVEKKQTLYSLSRQYEVAQEDIIRYNPQAAAGLREGEILQIPKPEDIYIEKKTEKAQEDISVKYLIHKVELKETLYSISKKYEVKQEDIKKLNPELGDILSLDYDLKIPYYPALITTDTIDGKTTVFLDWSKIFGKKDTVETTKLRIAFLLPFMLDNNDDINVGRFVDFYGGAVKAISEARKHGVSIDVYTFDTERSEGKMRDILTKNPVLKEVDLIIGPAYSAQVLLVTQFAKNNKVKTLIPFTSKVPDIEENPYLFQFNPGMDAELDFLKQVFATKFNNMNYIFADIEYVPNTDEGAIISKQIKAMLDQQGKKYETLSISDPAVNLFDSVAVYSKKNLFIFNTDQFQVAQPYFENLNLTDRNHDVILFERYNWKNQDVYRPIGFYIAPFKPEYEILNLNKYNNEFAGLLGWEAASHNPRFDILGYDLVTYFINMLNNGENNIDEKLELEQYREGIQSQFRFKRKNLHSGFINQQVYLGESQVK